MKNVAFSVSAKTARLIGRENIADVDGALTELIKNSYDADSTYLYVELDMPFPDIPQNIEDPDLNAYFSIEEQKKLLSFYEKDIELLSLELKQNLSEADIGELESIIFKKNRIIVLDNGHGMDESIISTVWMNIGTDDKEKDSVSPGGRVKTGAKGIGRFALDKLSTKTNVWSKTEGSELVNWRINWEQFENEELVSDVFAEISVDPKQSFLEHIKIELGERFELLWRDEEKKLRADIESNHSLSAEEKKSHILKINRETWENSWNTGTFIEMTPVRERWNKRLFNKVIKNLKHINPFGFIDPFTLRLENICFPEYNQIVRNEYISPSQFNYRIEAKFDGDSTYDVTLTRNDIDVEKQEVDFKSGNNIYKFNLADFWDRQAFKDEKYTRQSFEKQVTFSYELTELFPDENLYTLQQIGSFYFDGYFVLTRPDHSISKGYVMEDRKRLLSNYEGIKIYRDKFKVRPYGDFGDLFDWLALGRRQASSPAAPSHPVGRWRVSPNQIIGNVLISRFENPFLEDKMNRESISPSEAYYLFVHMLQQAIDTFEFDRQYVYREYAKWIKSKIGEADKIRNTINKVLSVKGVEDGTLDFDDITPPRIIKDSDQVPKDDMLENEEPASEEYESAIVYQEVLINQLRDNIRALMALGTSGVMSNTFAHELKALGTGMSVQSDQLFTRIQYHLKCSPKDYLSLHSSIIARAHNPYTLIENSMARDKLVGEWTKLVMSAIEKDSLIVQDTNIKDFTLSSFNSWESLMEKKYITFQSNLAEGRLFVKISESDLHIIYNNCFLNSSWFLEKNEGKDRIITVSTQKEKNYCVIQITDNGPGLDSKYKEQSHLVFNPTESTKSHENSTGLGLWIVKMIIDENSGNVKVMKMDEGFGLEIRLPLVTEEDANV